MEWGGREAPSTQLFGVYPTLRRAFGPASHDHPNLSLEGLPSWSLPLASPGKVVGAETTQAATPLGASCGRIWES